MSYMDVMKSRIQQETSQELERIWTRPVYQAKTTGGIWDLTDEENVWIKHHDYGWSRDYKPYSRRVRNAKLKKLLL